MNLSDLVRAGLQEVAGIVRQRGRHRPRPPRRGLVVEVGSGQSPHRRADLVIDKYIADDFERPGDRAFDFSRPLIVADGHSIPLADNAAAYVIALHVLEHAVHPVLFASEMSRVACAGFVQVPSRESELTFGWPYHPWLIDLKDGELVFEPKGSATAPIGEFWHRHYAGSVLVRIAWAAHRNRWHHSVEWKGCLKVRADGGSEPAGSAEFDLERTVKALTAVRVPPLPREAINALVCPTCHSSVVVKAEVIACARCAAEFPVVRGVPILVSDAAV